MTDNLTGAIQEAKPTAAIRPQVLITMLSKSMLEDFMKHIRTSSHGQAESAKQIDQTAAPKPISVEEDDLEKHLMEKRLTRFRRNWYERAARPARTRKS